MTKEELRAEVLKMVNESCERLCNEIMARHEKALELVEARRNAKRYLERLRLEAVGEEWDGRFRAIDQLNYAPEGKQTQFLAIDECDEPTIVKRGGDA